jgi:glycosyltransferase involved in cell wall biosynthesis
MIESQTLPLGDEQSLESDLVSVIIPCYNYARYLGQAIESVLAQSYSHFEIIVIDDGSRDSTAEVTTRYPEVRYVWQENQGLSAARNTGLRQSRGSYLIFLDADDLLLPDALEIGLNCLKERPDCAFVSGHSRSIREDGSLLKEYPQYPIGDNHYLALLQGNYIGVPATVIYRRAALETIGGFDTSLPVCEDYDLYLRLAQKFPLYRHAQVVAEYRRHGANMSGNITLMLKTGLAVLDSHGQQAKHDWQAREAYRAGIRNWQEYYGDKLLQQLGQGRAEGAYRQVIRDLIALAWYAPQYFTKYTAWWGLGMGSKLLRPVLPVAFRRWLVRQRDLPMRWR